MAEPLIDQILRNLEHAAGLYHRLILVVAPSGGGKTVALREVAGRRTSALINVNLELSARLLELTDRQRGLQLPRLLGEIVSEGDRDPVFLDNMEVVFDVGLRQDPLRLLQGVARNRTVVAAWNGSIENGHLTYAAPGHPEHRRYAVQDFLIASVEGAT